ncbi:glutamyl-tRNA reductase [Candidatus Magnetominusculus xianensis]|uniref:Glutamyl-tRNA reductase n=1 Tax=Candidatus Magnetominusculus xianensis TaxID=1748249 RepID=A0ABR5SJ84_9BACT|nr:glutamyl-tRNA reductase [Candidatus Magnetominusculus xianensis]KWT94354.1 glutamyl-tRNA reductase [Candidatus Magnetominusculus xianensis]MBF0403996.1 glutamyl-tRNA reductase [Nitrospirota bacterium]
MTVLVIGLNHKTADVEVRESIAFDRERIKKGLVGLRNLTGISEAIILSTCNRVELYLHADGDLSMVERVKKFLAEFHKFPLEVLDGALYAYGAEDGVRHLFRVASSLDSMVVGEPQILGQLKDAYEIGLKEQSSGLILNKLMKKAISVAKRVRTETKIAENAVSIGYAAVELAKKIFGDLGDKVFMLLGAGEMAELAARHLTGSGVKDVIVANRTYERGLALAVEFSGRAVEFSDFKKELSVADIVICSTGARSYILEYSEMEKQMKTRRQRPVFIIDISVPRNIDPKINSLENVYLYDIDDLQGVVDKNLNERLKESKKAEDIIDKEIDVFFDWLHSLDAIPTIVELRRNAEGIKNEELAKLYNKLNGIEEKDKQAIEHAMNAMINKLLHQPTMALKGNDEEKDILISAARKLYGLNSRPLGRQDEP